MAQNILEMKHITKKFPGVIALNDVSFDVKEGEILALVGENGAGKSTLMKILSGSYPHGSYDGEIFINGEKKIFNTPKQSEDAGIAMIYQEISMHLDLSVAENLFLGRWTTKNFGVVNWRAINTEAKKYLDLVKLDVQPEETLRSLSTSQMQMVSIARALAKNPKILVLDEPTSALTEAEAKNLFRIIHSLKENGITSILISHKLDEVFENADRITVLRDGKVVSTYLKDEVSRDTVVADMVGRKLESFYPKEAVEIGDVILKVENFTVPHPYSANKNIVEDVSFDVRSGEILGIAGLVGSGRSELVNAIFGKGPKASGRLFINGREIDIKNPKDAIRNGISLITEERKRDGLVEVLSIKQNTTLASLKDISTRLGVIRAKKENHEAEDYFKRLDIRAQGIETLVETLSGGNQQKVVLSKWLMTKPKIFIMDEPTRGIDVGAKYEIYKIMTSLARQGAAIVMISSELPELLSMSDRIIVLANGKLKGVFDSKESSHEHIIQLATGAM